MERFAVPPIIALRRRVERIASVPDDAPEGWNKSLVDPMDVVALFKGLSVKSGYVLRAYQYVSGDNGNGNVYAMPADAPFPEPDECLRMDNVFLEPPLPPAADAETMKYIDGDRSPRSYLLASLMARELAEFGAMWHGRSWSDQSILADASKLSTPWTWCEEPPSDLRPSVDATESAILVVFYTYTMFDHERVIRHTDQYSGSSYDFKHESTVIGHGQRGAVH